MHPENEAKHEKGVRHLLHEVDCGLQDVKETFCPWWSADGIDEKPPFSWAGDARYKRGISSASEGSRTERFQLPLGQAVLSGNYNLSISGAASPAQNFR